MLKRKLNNKEPMLIEVNSGAVLCPYCKTQIIPEYGNGTDDDETEVGSCPHLSFIFIWKGKWWDRVSPDVEQWWDDLNQKSIKVNGYSLRKCPHIDSLIEHSFCCGPANWAVSFGFKGALN
jgi:hypothetical protein